MKMLAYGLVANAFDKYSKIKKNTSNECLRRFMKAI